MIFRPSSGSARSSTAAYRCPAAVVACAIRSIRSACASVGVGGAGAGGDWAGGGDAGGGSAGGAGGGSDAGGGGGTGGGGGGARWRRVRGGAAAAGQAR